MYRRVGYLFCVVAVLGFCGASLGQEKATNPSPADGALDVAAPLFGWTVGAGAVVHRLYLGTDANLGPEDAVMSRQPQVMYFHVPGLTPGQTYYWRVDGIMIDATVIEGDVWTFMAQALTAYYPNPVDGDSEVSLTPDLTWLPGQLAQSHVVYFSDDRLAVADGLAEAQKAIVGKETEPNYAPGLLDPLSTYYWRVDEIVVGGAVQTGDVWSFTTIGPIDDFESYTNEVGERAFEVWVDGIGFTMPEPGNPGNGTGAAVGHDIWSADSHYTTIMEPNTVHGGLQSMPLYYDNTAPPYYSEVERTWATEQDWMISGADTLTLHVQGPVRDIEIPRATPVIDAEVDDLWQMASVQYIGLLIDGAAPDSPEDSSGSFQALCDSEYLYLLVDVNDESLVQDSAAGEGWNDDRIEVFIDGDNSKDAAQDGQNDYQYCFRWNHGQVETPVEWYRSPASLQGVEYAVVTTDTGYRFEIKLPWSTMIGGAPADGDFFGIDVMIGDDDDGGARDTQVSWHLDSGSPHTPSMWGTALVGEASVGAADLLYVALRDGSNHTGVVTNPDPNAVRASDWIEWKIPLGEFSDAGVDLASVRNMYIGIGDRVNPIAGEAGMILLDDIYLTKPAPMEDPNDGTG